LWVQIRLNITLCDKVCQWPVAGQWFSSVSSTNKTDHHIIVILSDVALSISYWSLRAATKLNFFLCAWCDILHAWDTHLHPLLKASFVCYSSPTNCRHPFQWVVPCSRKSRTFSISQGSLSDTLEILLIYLQFKQHIILWTHA
jgi:hypothetical protein